MLSMIGRDPLKNFQAGVVAVGFQHYYFSRHTKCFLDSFAWTIDMVKHTVQQHHIKAVVWKWQIMRVANSIPGVLALMSTVSSYDSVTSGIYTNH